MPLHSRKKSQIGKSQAITADIDAGFKVCIHTLLQQLNKCQEDISISKTIEKRKNYPDHKRVPKVGT